MRKISVYLTNKEREALEKLAAQSFRSVYDQAAFHIHEALTQRGLIDPNDGNEDRESVLQIKSVPVERL
jgi:hypothetical protein